MESRTAGVIQPLCEELRRRFRHERLIRQISRDIASKAMGVSRNTLEKFEGGDDGLQAQTIDKIARQLQEWEAETEALLNDEPGNYDMRLVVAKKSGTLAPPERTFSFSSQREVAGAAGTACA